MRSDSMPVRHLSRGARRYALRSAAAITLLAALSFTSPAAAGDNVVSFHGKTPTADGIINEFMKGGQGGSAGHPMIRMRGIRIQPEKSASGGATTGCPKTNTVVALDVKFDVNSAVLTADAYRTLRQMAEAMNRAELSACHFAIEGHTDATGSAAYNDALSKRRANSVKEFLLSMDVGNSRLKTVGMGSRDPLDPAHPRAGENRRVQFRIVGNGK